jgi:type IV secretory pathway TraG/TraD family ATPase VirD4
VPTLLRYRGSALVIDPKGENAAITARARQSILTGHTSPVYVINPWFELRETFRKLGIPSERLNPLDIIFPNDPLAVSVAQNYANVICPKTGGKDDYWQGAAATILTAVLLWLADQPGEKKTLARAREITSLPRKRFTEDFMLKMAASSAYGGAIRNRISPYLDLAADTYSGIISNLNENMKFIDDPQIQAITEFTTFDMLDILQQPTTIYIIIPPDKVEAQRSWLRLVIAMQTALHRAAKMSERPNPHRTLFLIDEFPALGRMQDMPSDLATNAGYGIDYVLVVQGLDQLKAIYKESAGTILSNCAFKWFCNVSDLECQSARKRDPGSASKRDPHGSGLCR